MNRNSIIIGVISTIVIVGLLWMVYATTNKPTLSNEVFKDTVTVRKQDHVMWNPQGKHTLTEYSDFQCPACRAFHEILKPMNDKSNPDYKLTQNVKFIYRHFPLSIHQNSQVAARAAEAAGKQNKFFEMHDLLFEKQEEWSESDKAKDFFKTYAKQLKLNVDQFVKDSESKELSDRVSEDMISGNTLGVDATPTFYLDGKKLTLTSIDDFKKALQSTVK